MGHLVTPWHGTGLVLFPRVRQRAFGATRRPGHAAFGDHLSSGFHVRSAAPYSHCMTQRGSASFLRQLLQEDRSDQASSALRSPSGSLISRVVRSSQLEFESF